MGRSGNIILFITFVITQIILSSLIDFGPLLFISVYPLFLLTRPANTSMNSLLLWAFTMGMVVDYFTNSIMGINSAAALVMTLLQFRILRLVSRKGDFDSQVRPGLRELGLIRFVSYIVAALLIHHIAISLAESFGMAHFLYNLPRMLISLFVNTLIIMLIEFGVFYKNWR
jgi:hypothetical protein